MADTIAAIATAPGNGGVSIVRLSGPEAEAILTVMFRPASSKALPLTSHMLTYGHVYDGSRDVDECMAVLMRAPRSYTREDVAELQLHGGGYTAQTVLSLCLRHGARLAEPGEFTRRAFMNGRIDLSQAEAVMSLIEARGRQAHDAALRQLSGGASGFIRQAADRLYDIQAGAAACIDYPEEISEEEAASDLGPQCLALADTLENACDERAARLLNEGFLCVLCGRPNAGKSSLLNALCGEELAIVTDIPGTTRDRVEGTILLDGALIRLVDTAGIRDTDDPVERIGVERARKALADADLTLAVLDGHQALTEEDGQLLSSLPAGSLILLTKQDLTPVITEQQIKAIAPNHEVLCLSAKEPESLQPLKQRLAAQARVDDRLALTQPRHMAAAREAAARLRDAERSLRETSVDFAAIELQAAQTALAGITGDDPT